MARSSEDYSCAMLSKEMLMHTDRPTPLGTLEKLPCEIRDMIYDRCHFSSQVLRLNTTIYFEYLRSLQRVYAFGILRFHVDPAKHPSSVQVLTEYGRPYGSINAANSHLQSDTNLARNIPVGLYEAINLEIDAPDPKDPGQAIRLCKQIMAVTASLSACCFPSTTSGIPSQTTEWLFPLQMQASVPRRRKFSPYLTLLQVKFKENSARSWKTGGEWNKSLADYDQGWNDTRLERTEESGTDVGLVLQMLCKLCRVPILILPNDLVHEIHCLSDIHREVRALSRITANLDLNGHDGVTKLIHWGRITHCSNITSGASKILAVIHSLQVWHEFLLDDLPGRSANLLRQERFQNWCGAYERQYGQALHGVPPRLLSEFEIPEESELPTAGACEHLEPGLWEQIKSSFHSRFWAMKSCHLDGGAGVERKSTNKLWTNFSERPLALVHPSKGFYVSDDEEERKKRRWKDATTDCIVCRAEEDRNHRVLAQKSLRGKPKVLNSYSVLGCY